MSIKPVAKIETKDHILNVATYLFSTYGFEGTSVRQLAERAGVNIAAINYYFGSKHNLYWAVVAYSHNMINDIIGELAQNSQSIEELIVNIFQTVAQDPTLYRVTMRMMLTEDVPDPDPEYQDGSLQAAPPGIDTISEILRREIKGEIKKEDLYWAARSMFGVLCFWCTRFSSTKQSMLAKNNKLDLSIEEVHGEIKRTISAIKYFLIQTIIPEDEISQKKKKF
ncbi:MAG: TetR/AcrR family transcriptional regulator [Bdellovibrionaceae bacterium]|nr:TetR/AcrR family transcriptional regulator [Pseudobdellovibrionaceae bacterium]